MESTNAAAVSSHELSIARMLFELNIETQDKSKRIQAEIEKIIAEIFYKKRQLEQLAPYTTVSEISNNFYNKILVEKAILKKKLDTVSESFMSKLVKRFFTPKKKLISDYFKDNCPMI